MPELLAPLQRKRKKPRITSTTSTVRQSGTPSVIPGVRHQVEGRGPIKQRKRTVKGRVGTKQDAIRGGYRMLDVLREKAIAVKGAKKFNKAEADRYGLQQTRRAAQDEARGRLRTIEDPEAGEAARRKKAARRRMRGRMGTILTQPQTLGAKGTLG